MEIPGTHYFRRHGFGHPLLGHALDRCVIQHHGGMNDPPQRSHRPLDIRYDLPRLFAIGDIRFANPHLGAPLPHHIHSSQCRWRGIAAACEGDLPSSTPYQAVGDSQPESSKPAGDQVGCVGIERESTGLRLDLQPLRIVHRDNQLTDVLRLRHLTQRINNTRHRKYPVRERPQFIVFKSLQHLAQNCRPPVTALNEVGAQIDCK